MSLRINDETPDFTASTTHGTLNFYEWIGSGWAILFSHPKDFTPVCTTELGYMAKLEPEFKKRNCKIIGLSVDSVENHTKWAKDIEETQGYAVNYPMIGDSDLAVAKLYNNEILRVLDSMQLTAKHKVATPVNWKNGNDVIIVPSVSDDEAKSMFTQGWKTLKPYLRLVKQPR